MHTRTYAGFVVAGVQQNNRLASASYPDPSPMPGRPISVSYGYDSVGNCVSEGSERKYEWTTRAAAQLPESGGGHERADAMRSTCATRRGRGSRSSTANKRGELGRGGVY